MTTIKQAIADKQALIERAKFALQQRQHAAQLERAGKYAEAHLAWEEARKTNRGNANEEWCINRSDFCERMKTRPFKGANDAE